MRRGFARIVCFGCALAIGLAATPALADDDSDAGGTPRRAVPLRAPPAPSQVPVPDVRGMPEADAARALAEGGLRIGGVERVSVARLEAELGHQYTPGSVVQQAPRPSTDEQPSWLARGGSVWLRVATAGPGGIVRPPTPAVPARPRGLTPPTEPLGTMPRYTGRVPVPPPPAGYATSRPLPVVPAQPPVAQPPVAQPPVVVPPVVQPPVVQPPVVQPPVVQPPVVQLPVTQPQPDGTFVEPEPETFYGTADIRSRVTLPCERRQARWHVRPVAGAAFWLGDDNGDVAFYGGVDVGRTFSSCFGVDVFYRYSGGTFDRDVVGGLLEDSGSFQHVGVKGTYNASLDGEQLFFFAGLGISYFWADGLRVDDDGVAGFVELGLGYALSDAIRIRIGVNIHAMDTEAGRRMMIDDSNTRLLWTVAPSLALELDI